MGKARIWIRMIHPQSPCRSVANLHASHGPFPAPRWLRPGPFWCGRSNTAIRRWWALWAKSLWQIMTLRVEWSIPPEADWIRYYKSSGYGLKNTGGYGQVVGHFIDADLGMRGMSWSQPPPIPYRERQLPYFGSHLCQHCPEEGIKRSKNGMDYTNINDLYLKAKTPGVHTARPTTSPQPEFWTHKSPRTERPLGSF